MKHIDLLMEQINSLRNERSEHVNVLLGSAAFSRACRVSAVTLGLIACAQTTNVMDAAKLNQANLPSASPTAPNIASAAPVQAQQVQRLHLSTSADVPLIDRLPLAQTPALLALLKVLPDQKPKAEMISQEQMQVLRYGEHPPVKTTVRISGKLETQWTLHPFDLVRLAREAATKASALEGIRVDPNKVGAVMIAESAMVSRVGWSSNGKTPSFGLAQLEERTAKSLGVSDLNDPRQSAFAAARLVAEGQKLANANRSVNPALVTSLSYNTSSATRKMLIAQYGSSLRIEHLPSATQAHVKNMAYGEQRMNMFAKLRDQHEKSIATSIEAARLVSPVSPVSSVSPPSPPSPAAPKTFVSPQEPIMHKPLPSTRSLVSNIPSDSGNQIRLVNNQRALELSGHIQTVPMTSRGLNEMRQAISTNILRASDAGNPANLSRDLHAAPTAVLLSSVGQPMQSVVNSLMTKVNETYTAVAERLKAAFHVVSNSPAATTAKLMHEQKVAEKTVHDTSLALREMREDTKEQERSVARQHPGFMQSSA